MMDGQVALYARVSSEQQAEANTIDSQVAALREWIRADGFDLRSVLEFIDAGYSGSSLVRPALERLRDVAAAGGIDRLYVHCPDRFARHYAYQVLLLDELTQRGVEVLFLNRLLGHTPEDQLLLQVQGVIAEYERAKFLERSRRGKRHAAQEGRVGVLCHAPYGYRYVPKQEGGGDARFDIVYDEARVVQQVFTWVGRGRCTINVVCRRLHQASVRTRPGKAYWDHKTIWDVSVQVVDVRATCYPMSMSRNIAVHESRAPIFPRAMGANPRGGARLYPHPRSARDDVGGRHPAVGSNGPAIDRVAAARLAHLVAPAVE